MLTLKVANKALIKSTWKELPCQKERQRHKSLPLFNGLCPFICGRQPWRLWPLCPVCRVVYSPGYKSQWKSCANTMHRKGRVQSWPCGHGPSSRSLSSPVCQGLLTGGRAVARATSLLCGSQGRMASLGEASHVVFSSYSLGSRARPV